MFILTKEYYTELEKYSLKIDHGANAPLVDRDRCPLGFHDLYVQ